jgi:predicted TIM-barrel fold metal-dependent hydrolase
MISRRELIAGALAAGISRSAPRRPEGVLIDTHVHLFAGDETRFPYSPLSYKPKPNPVEQYVRFASELGIDHSIIVHPEPYQDDHRYLEYSLTREPSKGFFKATCLFDPIDPKTPERMKALVQRNPGRIVAIRIHEMHLAGTPSTTTGAIRDRDLKDPQMTKTWQAARELGIGILVQLIPYYAPQIRELAVKFPKTPVILDHLARPKQGTTAEYDQVLRLADLPRVYIKFSRTGLAAASRQPFPYVDAKPLVQRVHAAFGADRMIWGELGSNMTEFDEALQLFDSMLDFASENDRAKIRGLTARKLFAFA